MTARAIVSGVLYKRAEEKVSKAGKPYAIATVREGNGDNARWWRVAAFSASAIEALLTMQGGEPIAIAGEFDCELYQPNGGEPQISWKLTADVILTARKPPKSRADKPSIGRAASPSQREGALDDDIPF